MTAPSPPAGPVPKTKSGPGCLVIALLLPVVIIVGLVVGAALSDKEDPGGEESANIGSGTLNGTPWRVDAERDVEGVTCVFLYDDEEQLAGACDATPQDSSFGDRTVVFGIAPSSDASVSVMLSDGRAVDIATQEAEGIPGRFYVEVVDGDVDATDLAP